MNKLILRGGVPLYGEITVGGFKNAALPILFATVLTGGTSIIENLPLIRDVLETLEILRAIGAEVSFLDTHTVSIDTKDCMPCMAPDALVSGFRASSYLLGAELGRFGRARVALPGGCRIGQRPLDFHVLAVTALGADVVIGNGAMTATASGLNGGMITFPTPSVGATVNAILASVLAEGKTVIRGAAREPHIGELCRFLNAAGAEISGVGEGTLTINGVARLCGVHHTLMPDMIEAGTFLTAVGVSGGEILVRGAEVQHLKALVAVLTDMGMRISSTDAGVLASRRVSLSPCRVIAEPYPGLPTDMHPQLAALATYARGESEIRDSVFPDRFAYADELLKMGASLSHYVGRVEIRGSAMHGAHVTARDLRAGAALAVAALGAAGRTVISSADILERGYEDFPKKLGSLGASVAFQ